MDRRYRRIGIDYHDTHSIASRNRFILSLGSLEESIGLFLEAAFLAARRGQVTRIAPTRPAERDLRWREQQKRQVRPQAAADLRIEPQHRLRAKLASSALVGFGRIRPAIAQQQLARGQRRLHDLGDGLGAVGEHHGQLGARRQRHARAGFEQELPDTIAEGGSAGLAHLPHRQLALPQHLGKAAQLRRLTRAVQPLKADEKTASHGMRRY